MNFACGGKDQVMKRGVALRIKGLQITTRHLSVGCSMTHWNKTKFQGKQRCFLGAALRCVVHAEHDTAMTEHEHCSGGFAVTSQDEDEEASAFKPLVECPACLPPRVQWHGTCGICLSKSTDTDAYLACHGMTEVMTKHNYKLHKAA